MISRQPSTSPSRQDRQALDLDASVFRADFNRRPFAVRHRLTDHPLFALPRLIELARRLPPKLVEYNAGNVPVSLDPTQTPRTGLSIEETIRRIEECQSWMVLKNVEQDPEYNALLDQCLDEVRDVSEAVDPGMFRRGGFIFISSADSVTPFHMDDECNFLLQIRGKKFMNVFDSNDRSLVSEMQLERFSLGVGHRNLEFQPDFQTKARVFELNPGDGVHVPVTAPHWVKNGDTVSISFSITFHTRATERRRMVYAMNLALRQLGLNPSPYGVAPMQDKLKFGAALAVHRGKRLLSRGRR
jgi:hypothetical protein